MLECVTLYLKPTIQTFDPKITTNLVKNPPKLVFCDLGQETKGNLTQCASNIIFSNM